MTATDTRTCWTADDADEFVNYFTDFGHEQWVDVASSVGRAFARALRTAGVRFTHSPRHTICIRPDNTRELDRFTRVRWETRPRLR